MNECSLLRLSYKTDYVSPIVLGNEDNIKSLASKHALDLTQIEIIDPATSELKDELVDAFVERRKGKATKEQAVELLDNVNYFEQCLCILERLKV